MSLTGYCRSMNPLREPGGVERLKVNFCADVAGILTADGIWRAELDKFHVEVERL